jgi:DNA polymerase III delta subunit
MREDRARVDPALIAQTLKIKPFVAQKALAIAQKLNEQSLLKLLTMILESDKDMKTGKDEVWALESLALRMANFYKG